MSPHPRLRVLAIAPMTLAIAACGGIKVNNTVPQYKFPPTCTAAVELYQTAAEIPASYYEIALITAEGNSVWTDDDRMVEKMKGRAARVGANGMVVDAIKTSATAVQVIGAALGSGDADRKGRAIAIFMPSREQRARAACQTGG